MVDRGGTGGNGRSVTGMNVEDVALLCDGVDGGDILWKGFKGGRGVAALVGED